MAFPPAQAFIITPDPAGPDGVAVDKSNSPGGFVIDQGANQPGSDIQGGLILVDPSDPSNPRSIVNENGVLMINIDGNGTLMPIALGNGDNGAAQVWIDNGGILSPALANGQAIFVINGNDTKVGIGIETPAYELEVNGTAYADNLLSSSYYLEQGTPASIDNGQGAIYLNGNDLFFINSNGDLSKLNVSNKNGDLVSLWNVNLGMLHPTSANGNQVIGIGGNTHVSADILLNPDGSAVFNNLNNATNFQIKGSTEDNLFYVNGSTNSIGIGTDTPGTGNNAPVAVFDIQGKFRLADGTQSNGKILVSDSNGYAKWVPAGLINTGNGGNGAIFWDMNASKDLYPVDGVNGADAVSVLIGGESNGTADIVLSNDGSAIFNNNKNQADFTVRGESVDSLIYADAEGGKVGIRVDSPDAQFEIGGSLGLKATGNRTFGGGSPPVYQEASYTINNNSSSDGVSLSEPSGGFNEDNLYITLMACKDNASAHSPGSPGWQQLGDTEVQGDLRVSIFTKRPIPGSEPGFYGFTHGAGGLCMVTILKFRNVHKITPVEDSFVQKGTSNGSGLVNLPAITTGSDNVKVLRFLIADRTASGAHDSSVVPSGYSLIPREGISGEQGFYIVEQDVLSPSITPAVELGTMDAGADYIGFNMVIMSNGGFLSPVPAPEVDEATVWLADSDDIYGDRGDLMLSINNGSEVKTVPLYDFDLDGIPVNADSITRGILDSEHGGTGIDNNGRTLTFNGDLVFNVNGSSSATVTLPSSGQLVSQNGIETLTNKTLDGVTITSSLRIADGSEATGKVLTTDNLGNTSWINPGLLFNGSSSNGTSQWDKNSQNEIYPFDLNGSDHISVVIGDNDSSMADIVLGNNGEAIFNQEQNLEDFRVASNGLTHTMYVNGTADTVGINTASPQSLFHVNGTLAMTDGTEGLDKILVSDAFGNATWKTKTELGLGAGGSSLTVISYDASPGSTGFSRSSDLTITFNTLVIPGNGSILIKEEQFNGTVFALDVEGSNVTFDNNKVILNPPSNLPYGQDLYIEVPATAIKSGIDILDTWPGIVTNDNSTWYFQTEIHPGIAVTSTSPSNPVDSKRTTFEVEFNTDISLNGSAAGTLVEIRDTDLTNPAVVQYTSAAIGSNLSVVGGGDTLRITIPTPSGNSDDLEFGDDYYINISADLIINDNRANDYFTAYANTTGWNFQVEAIPTLNPSNFSPTSGSTSRTANLVFNFDEPVTVANSGGDEIVIINDSDDSTFQTIQHTSASLSNSDRRITINPNNFMYGRTYRVTSAANWIENREYDGDFYPAIIDDNTWTFTVEAAPSVGDTEEFNLAADASELVSSYDLSDFLGNSSGAGITQIVLTNDKVAGDSTVTVSLDADQNLSSLVLHTGDTVTFGSGGGDEPVPIDSATAYVVENQRYRIYVRDNAGNKELVVRNDLPPACGGIESGGACSYTPRKITAVYSNP